MLASYEFEGKTKEAAIKSACEELGVSEGKLEIEVLSYGSTGIFGLVGAKKAQIRVTLREAKKARIDEARPKPVKKEDEARPKPVKKEDEEKPDQKEDLEAVAEIAQKTSEEIISYVVDDATVTVEKYPDVIKVRIDAGNAAILIGKHGRTLDALQFIIRKIVRKRTNSKVRISFDVEGYRDRRKASLTQMALRLGEKVKRSGKPATISPMNAYDRRIVHIALKEDTSVRTQSKGGGLFRKLVILPQKRAR
ncbi:MAG: RNA-binding cell elongation regulator Jag/EloR [Desulfobacteria bacterium]